MAEPHQFRHYLIVQDAGGGHVELERSAEQVAVLAFDTQRFEFVHCHVLLNAMENRAPFEEACRRLRGHGHPLLSRLVDYGEDDGNPFYITSTADGEALGAYLGRQSELPGWLAVMIAVKSLEAAAAVCLRGDFLPEAVLNSFRVVQVAAQSLAVIAADFRLLPNSAAAAAKSRALKANFEKQSKFLTAFLMEQTGGGPTMAEHPVVAVDFAEILAACLEAASPSVVASMLQLRTALQKLVPVHVMGEIPSGQKPRALLAPLLASYQDVARTVVNRVRIQSQRLDMTNPYSMRGTLTKSGRPVLVEQVPGATLVGQLPLDAAELVQKLTKKNHHPHLVRVAAVQTAGEISCLVEEVVEGISVAELLRERGELEVQEAYLLLAGVDAALADLDSAALPCNKLRLEDLFLLVGSSRDDPRTGQLLRSKLTDWPTFSVILRGHACLAGMAARGTDPGVLLPPNPVTSAQSVSRWHGGWMAAVGRFLLGVEELVGASQSGDREGGRRPETEAVERLLEDEIARTIEGRPSSRAEFLSRYARIVQHYDLVKPVASALTLPPAISETPPVKKGGLFGLGKGAAKPVAKTTVLPKGEDLIESGAGVELGTSPIAAALTGAVIAPGQGLSVPPSAGDGPSIGLGEIFFKGTADPVAADEPDWARRQPEGLALPTDFEVPEQGAPWWLKASVFLLGSMALGGVLSHQSGDALWQKNRKLRAVPVLVSEPEGDAAESGGKDLDALRGLQEKPAFSLEEPEKGVILRAPPSTSLRNSLDP